MAQLRLEISNYNLYIYLDDIIDTYAKPNVVLYHQIGQHQF